MATIEFRAGKMKLSNGQLRPDSRKGMVKLAMSPEDQLLHLTWRSRENGVVEDDRIIFPGASPFPPPARWPRALLLFTTCWLSVTHQSHAKRSTPLHLSNVAGDATFAYVEQARGNAKNSRVYVLKFSNSSERLFFWMQEPSDAKDKEYCKSINAKISGEQPAGLSSVLISSSASLLGLALLSEQSRS